MAPEVVCVEAHGTGTALGDPIEASSLKGTLLSHLPPAASLSVGSVKANAAHAEPAAGATGLLRLTLGLLTARAPPNAQLRVANEHVLSALEGAPCALPTQLAALRQAPTQARAGGVSSFGYSGTIVHAVLRAAPRSPATLSGR